MNKKTILSRHLFQPEEVASILDVTPKRILELKSTFPQYLIKQSEWLYRKRGIPVSDSAEIVITKKGLLRMTFLERETFVNAKAVYPIREILESLIPSKVYNKIKKEVEFTYSIPGQSCITKMTTVHLSGSPEPPSLYYLDDYALRMVFEILDTHFNKD